MQVEGLTNLVVLQSFTVFPEYFISVSIIYVLIVVVLITYNVYGLMLQKAVSDCLALVFIMACYLIINDDLLVLNFLSFNNSIINDYLGFIAKFVVCASSALYFLIISNYLKVQRLTSFEYLLITAFAVLGLVLMCSSNDLLTAYLAIELSSLACYLLATFKKNSSYSVESGIKYFIIGSVSSAFFLLGSSLIYGVSGSINFSDFAMLFDTSLVNGMVDVMYSGGIYVKFDAEVILTMLLPWFGIEYSPYMSITDFSLLELGLTLIIFSLFIKLALAPFHLWSLDVYEGSPTTATFFFAVIGKLSIFVLLVRLCYVCFFWFADSSWQMYSLWIGVLSIFVGSFGGLKQRKLKTLLAYSSTSHMGYALIAFSSHYIGIQMLFFYLIVYIIAGLATWSIILSLRLKKRDLYDKHSKELADIVSLNKANSALAFGFALTMFSVAGIPPLIGFLAKMNVFLSFISVIEIEFITCFIALISILFSVVSTFYYIRVIKVLYFENTLAGELYYPINTNKTLILSFLVLSLVFLFINPTILYLYNYKILMSL
jgi:NADH-quinone oxidoreductase subunit N